MVFTSEIFLFIFLPFTIIAYYLLNDKYRNLFLLLASLLFYSWGEPHNVLIMLFSVCVNYFVGLALEKTQREGKSLLAKSLLLFSLLFNLGLLGYFKYSMFVITNINRLTGIAIPWNNIALPIGISFFTFQILSYVIDVYRGEKAQHNILDLGLYIALFPQLIAGPIVRYSDIINQIKGRVLSVDKFYSGCLMFMMGFSKKILIADQLSPFVADVFNKDGMSSLVAWVGAIAYSLQIYFDFSGYSDMAIGIGKMLGFEFMQNFNYPYIANSVKDFWRRWHISLSTWFRDYVYIPLGGSRCSQLRNYSNLIVVFFLTGLWHGASWNFIAWGLYYVVFLIIERLGFGRLLERIPPFFSHAYTLFVIVVGWVFFRAESLTRSLLYIKSMFTITNNCWGDLASIINKEHAFCLLIGIVFSLPIGKKVYQWSTSVDKSVLLQLVSILAIIATFLLAICYMVGNGFSPFLYFRF